MKHYCLILVCLFFSLNVFADNLKVAERVTTSSLPFECSKTTSYPNPAYAFPVENFRLPLKTYRDLGLTEKNTIPSTDCVIFRRFKFISQKFDIIALDINVSDWNKKLLVAYSENDLTDYIEAEVCWYPDDIVFVKQWRITSDEEIIVTWLKVLSETPINAFSNFKEVTAQRIDMHYRIDANGKFQLTKEVKYVPRNYTRTYLADKTKNLWEGDETPIME